MPSNLTEEPQGITVLPMQTITFKVPEEEAKYIKEEAQNNNLSISEFIRRKIRNQSEENEPVREVFCPITRTTIFAGSQDLPLLTSKSVEKILADFP